MKKHLILFLLLAGGLACAANAQPEVQPRPDAEQIHFDHLSSDDGLSQHSVYAIVQDRRGFMWFGTQDGLNRYDGYQFTTYAHDPEDDNSLSPGYILSILEDRNGLIWIGLRGGGLNRFDPATDSFTSYRHNPDDPTSLSDDRVTALHESRDGTLWAGSYGLNRFDPEKETFTRILPVPDDSVDAGNYIQSIHEDRRGTLWLGTAGGLFRLDTATDSFTSYRHNPDDPTSLSDDRVTALHESRDGTLWVGSWGLHRFDPDTETFERFFVDPEALDAGSRGRGVGGAPGINRVKAISEDHTGTLWIGTAFEYGSPQGGGLNRFDPSTGTFTRFLHDPADPRSLISNSVWSIYQDRQGLLWVGSEGGVSRFDRLTQRFALYRHHATNPNSLQGTAPRGLYLDRDDVLWVGTQDGVLNRFDRLRGIVRHYRHNPSDPLSLGPGSVQALHRDGKGVLWVGTSRGGLNRFEETTGRFTRYVHDPDDPGSISSNNVRVIYEDQSGTLWVGAAGGLNQFDPGRGRFKRHPNSLSANDIRVILEDRKGMLWIGTRTGGLTYFDPETGNSVPYRMNPVDPYSLSNDEVLGLYEHPPEPDILWVSTLGGLNRLDKQTGRFLHFTKQNSGLPSNSVYSVLGDDAGRLWMSTNRGIARFSPDENKWKIFNSDDGLQMLEFDSFAFHQGYTGELFFGGAGGVNAVLPGADFDNTRPPQVALTALRLEQEVVKPDPDGPLKQPLAETTTLTLAHRQHDLTFSYVGLHFRHPEKNQYRYLLEGYDETWSEETPIRQATYTNLPPGAYTFRVKAANSDGVWNEEGASLKVIILPPWWRTAWAYALYALLLIAAVAAAFRVQHARIVQREREAARERELEQARAIEHAYHQLEEAHHDLEQTHQHLQTTQKQLVQSEKMASLGALTAGIAHEIKNPLNFVNNFAEVNEELADELREALARGEDVGDLLADLKQNASVIAQHGKRADAIVQNMMQHASGGTGEREAVEVNALVGEYVELAYHGKRAQTPGFRVALERDLGVEVGRVEMVPQEIGRVLLNLLSNAFDAVHEHAATAGDAYAPTVTVSTRRNGKAVEIRVSDNGSGIASEIKEKIFEPFFTTKPTGSGTGLGLSLAYDIVVQGHGGTLEVGSAEGEGATFVITLPA